MLKQVKKGRNITLCLKRKNKNFLNCSLYIYVIVFLTSSKNINHLFCKIYVKIYARLKFIAVNSRNTYSNKKTI